MILLLFVGFGDKVKGLCLSFSKPRPNAPPSSRPGDERQLRKDVRWAHCTGSTIQGDETMSVEKTILIAEDAPLNRKILVRLLSEEYTLLEAENGQAALDLLYQHGTAVSAVILDLVMPVLDGFGFLRAIQAHEEYRNIPIIVATGNGSHESEMDALKLGAWDFITKPYNGEIIKFRLRNAIERSQLSAFNQLKYLAEFDTLTGIYNKTKFFQMTRRMLDIHPEGQFAFIRLDIDRFQLVNSFFGTAEGDRLLCYLAGSLTRADCGDFYTYGRMEADVFAVCFSYVSREAVLGLLETYKELIKSYNRSFEIVPIFGVYFLDDLSLPISEMLDRATLAAKTCKGSYTNTVAVYQEEFSRKLEREQEIINEMTGALEKKQFCVYLQPKYSLLTNMPAGAEALVRWQHPVRGMISPGSFIPVFEKNGFIAKLDYFVWETVCGMLQEWLSRDASPAPISVNVSRVNLYNPNLSSLLTELVRKYRVPPRLLQLEMTESAYMDNPQLMEQAIRQLHGAGFTILMDDFGSGYSSLSMLKDIEVDVLKIDMRFFEKARTSGRGENIVASVIRMAKWLNIPVTAEGVETQEQVDFLRSVGCDFVQGFCFSKPLPKEEYESLIREERGSHRSVPSELYAGLNPDRLWSLDPEILLLFADDPIPKAFYEFDGSRLDILRVNKSFGTQFFSEAAEMGSDPLLRIFPEDRPRVLQALAECAEQRVCRQCEYRRRVQDGKVLWIRLELQYVQPIGTKHILLGQLSDISAFRALEEKYREALCYRPDLCSFAAEHVFSPSDIRALLTFLREVFDVARLVDSVHTALVDLDEKGFMTSQPYTCFRMWNKETRCENCTGIRAMQGNCKMTKYEYIKNEIFYVVSNPVTVRDQAGTEHSLALELVSHVSNHLTMGTANEQSIGQLIEETQRKIYTDELTGAYNRRYLTELLFAHHHRTGIATKLGLVLLDLKNFKSINDRFGHAEGDRVLAEAARSLQKSVRPSDSVIRYGGDEFVALLTQCGQAQVQTAVRRMQRAISSVRFGPDKSEQLQADFGCAYNACFDVRWETVEKMLQEADSAMYQEKNRPGQANPVEK